MRHSIVVSLLFAMLSLSFSTPHVSNNGTLSIEINNIQSSQGMVWVGIYASEQTFLVKEKAIVEGFVIREEGQLIVDIPDLKFGEYAVAVFHDENNNGVMDRNLLGIPSEPFAFSKPPKSKWRLPKFEEVRFSFAHPDQKVSTHLKKWWEKRKK